MFRDFTKVVRDRFNEMAKGELYVVDITKSVMWENYMDAFPAGTNEMYKERRAYDCNSCKQFINRVGNVVAIVDNKLVSVWDVIVDTEEEYYQTVADSMSELVKSATIRTKFLYDEKNISTEFNHAQNEETGAVTKWHHFSCELPNRFVDQNRGATLSGIEATKHVFERGLQEMTAEAISITLDLILSDSIYRGAEFKEGIESFGELKKEYDTLSGDIEKSIYVWSKMGTPGARIRNTAIGTLLTDISEGVELTEAVKKFEAKVAPANYKRSSAPITKGMIDGAMKTIRELGIEESLQRRFAVIGDVSVNNVFWASRATSVMMQDSLESMLMGEVKQSVKTFDGVEEIAIEDFITNVLPNAESVEVLMKNNHQTNLMSLIAPSDPNSKNILKWDNNFSFGYNGNVTDSMKENVKKAGGKVDGDLRYSIQWNDKRDNNDDLDAHAYEPKGGHISFQQMRSRSSGTLDVDITNPNSQCPNGPSVENIIYTDKSKMPEGDYEFVVNNYSKRGGSNFSAEVEFDGKIYAFQYSGKVTKDVTVAVVNYTKANGFVLVDEKSLKHTASSNEIWGVATETFIPVTSMMLSPNHWDGQNEGNKHYFFILDGCNNPEEARGLYNEFLDNSLTPHRKVFEVLAGKMKCPVSTDQLSGLGFSSTQRNELICKVTGNFERTLKIKF